MQEAFRLMKQEDISAHLLFLHRVACCSCRVLRYSKALAALRQNVLSLLPSSSVTSATKSVILGHHQSFFFNCR